MTMGKKLTIDEDRIKECMKDCPDFKRIAKKLWPEVEEEEKEYSYDIVGTFGNWEIRQYQNDGFDDIIVRHINGDMICRFWEAGEGGWFYFMDRDGRIKTVYSDGSIVPGSNDILKHIRDTE